MALQASDDRLTSLLAQVNELKKILVDEGQALGEADVRQLDSTLQNKRTVLENLLSFADEELAREYAGTPQWEEFVETLGACRQQNLVNGASMTQMAQSRQRALRVLYGQDANAEVYSADGQATDTDRPARDLGEA